MSNTAEEINSIAHALKSIVETLAPTKKAGGMTFDRLCDLHTEFSPLVMQKLVRYLESHIIIARAPTAEELSYWTTEGGLNALKIYNDAAWWRLAREFVGS
jgi:hypothetical protein